MYAVHLCFFYWQIKKSIVATETATKISTGQAAGNAKGNLAKTPAASLAPQS
jgi:hypothetical protein